MNTTTRAVSRLTTAILIGTVALAVLPAAAKAAAAKSDRTALLARSAGYGTPDGSSRVRVLQRRLRLAGENPGQVDGLFGPRTEGAVLRYQQRAGLAVDGIVGPKTRAALRRSAKVVRPGAGYGVPHGSARVRALQRSLRLAGANPGPIDGRFGPQTETAVVRFQEHHRLAADGLAGEQTISALARVRTRVADRTQVADRSRADRRKRAVAHRPARVLDVDTEGHKNVHEPAASVSRGTIILALIVLLAANAAVFMGARMLPNARRGPAARAGSARGTPDANTNGSAAEPAPTPNGAQTDHDPAAPPARRGTSRRERGARM